MSEGNNTKVVSGEEEELVHPLPPTPVKEEEKSSLSNLSLRLMTAAVLIPVVSLLIWVGGILYVAALVLITTLGLREFYELIREKGAHPLVGYGLAAGASLPVVAFLGSSDLITLVMTIFLLTSMVVQLSRARVDRAMASISGTFFGVFYIGWLLSYAVLLRNFHLTAAVRFGPQSTQLFPEDVGCFFMFFTVTAVVVCDAGAYFCGRAYGRHKLAPKVSPGKTVEGALGGILLGGLSGPVVKVVFGLLGTFEFFGEAPAHWAESLGWLPAFFFGVMISAVGIVGDLVESLLKRDAQSKDTGALLPGMGGVLDRIDSCLLGIPVMYYLLLGYSSYLIWVKVP